MDDGRRDPEIALEVRLCWRHAVNLSVVVDEREILALARRERPPHRSLSVPRSMLYLRSSVYCGEPRSG